MRNRKDQGLFFGSLAVLVMVFGAWTPVEAQSSPSRPVMPRLTWNEAEGRLIATVPPEIRAWLAGEVDDPDGSYGSWMERYDEQRDDPSFGAALFELQRMVTTTVSETGITKFQVENELLPTLLRERGDLARGLSGESTFLPQADPQCFRIESGTEYCGQQGFMCCLGDLACCCTWHCDLSVAGSCSVTESIPCPGGSSGLPGTTEIQQRR